MRAEPCPKKISLGSYFFVLGSLAILGLFSYRAWHVLSFSHPLQIITSGFEEESWFAIWKYIQHQPVYTNPHDIPFTAAYFNWFFYVFYGTLIHFLIHFFHLEESWIPVLGHFITVGIGFLGFLLSYRLFLNTKIQQALQSIPFALSILLWFGPLTGFWTLTLRPDLLALFFEVCAVAALLRSIQFEGTVDRVSGGTFLLTLIAVYLAWACKQVNVIAAGAIALFLLWEKRWKAFLIFSFGFSLMVVFTLGLAKPEMRNMLLFFKTAVPLSFTVLKGNLWMFIKKAGVALWLCIAFCVLGVVRRKQAALVSDPVIRLSLCGIVVWMCTLFPASSKLGSAENYYFILLFFMLLLVSRITNKFVPMECKASQCIFGVSGGLLMSMVVMLMLLGGGQELVMQQQNNDRLASCVRQLPAPSFVINHYGALPWVNPRSPAFVLAYNYWNDRKKGYPFEAQGVGGLIEQGYFKALILPKEYHHALRVPFAVLSAAHRGEYFDGGSLEKYRYVPVECMGYAVYHLASEAG